jgi:hypothetical protein
MLTIRNEQLAAFETASWDQFAQNQLEHVRAYFPADHRMLGGDEGTLAFIYEGIERARNAGIRVFGDACRYLDLMLSLGLDFAVDPQLPFASAILDDDSTDVRTRVDLLHGAAIGWLERVAGSTGQHYARAARAAMSLSYEQASAEDETGDLGESFRAIYPRLWLRKNRDLRSGATEPFLALAKELALRDGFAAPGARVVYAGLMFLLGSRFATDPLYPWAAAIVGKDADPEEKARALLEAARDHFGRTLEAMRESA